MRTLPPPPPPPPISPIKSITLAIFLSMSLHSFARAQEILEPLASETPDTTKQSPAPESSNTAKTPETPNTSKQPTGIERFITPGTTSKKPNPHYHACQDTDLSKLEALTGSATEPTDDSAKTEAEFCFSCEWEEWKNQARDLVGLKTVEKPKELPHAKEFKERLRKRAIGQVMAKIYQSESTRACLRSDEDWFLKKGAQMDKALCTARTKELKQAVKDSWPEMRINMALRDAKLGGSASYGVQAFKMMDDTPSHTALPDTVDIPPLTKEEKQIARDRHIEALSILDLDKLSPEDLAKQLREKKKLGSTKHHVTGINQRDLTNKDIDKIQDEQRHLREKSEADYLTMIAKMPFLAYLKDGKGKTKDIDQAFFTLSKYLTDFLKKLEDPEVDMAVLLSFNSLAEELLAEDSKYCLAAEGAMIDAQEDESFDNYALMGLGLASIVPCFIAGPVTLSACVAGGTAVGVAGYAEAKAAQRSALDSVLSGANLEKLSEWRANGQNAKIEAMLLPLAVIGAPVSAGLRVAKEGLRSVVSATGRGAVRGSVKSATEPRAGREGVKSVTSATKPRTVREGVRSVAEPRADREGVKSVTSATKPRTVREGVRSVAEPRADREGVKSVTSATKPRTVREGVRSVAEPRAGREGVKPITERVARSAPKRLTRKERATRREQLESQIRYPYTYRPIHNNPVKVEDFRPKQPLPISGDEDVDRFRIFYNSGAYSRDRHYEGIFFGHTEESRYISVKYNGEMRPAVIGSRLLDGNILVARVKMRNGWEEVWLDEEKLKTARLNTSLYDEVLSNQSPEFKELPMTGDEKVDLFRKIVNKGEIPSYYDDEYNRRIRLDYFGDTYYGKVESISRNPQTGQPEVTVNLLEDRRMYDIPNSRWAGRSDHYVGSRVIDNRNLPFIRKAEFDEYFDYTKSLDRIRSSTFKLNKALGKIGTSRVGN